MPLELTMDPLVLYVHVLHLDDVEQVRRDILHLTDLTVRAFGSAEAVAAQDEYLRRTGRLPMIAAAYAVLGARRRAVRSSGCCAGRRWPTGSSASTG